MERRDRRGSVTGKHDFPDAIVADARLVGETLLTEQLVERRGLKRSDQAEGLTRCELADGVENRRQWRTLRGAERADVEFEGGGCFRGRHGVEDTGSPVRLP